MYCFLPTGKGELGKDKKKRKTYFDRYVKTRKEGSQGTTEAKAKNKRSVS